SFARLPVESAWVEERFVKLESESDIHAAIGVLTRAEIAVAEARDVVSDRSPEILRSEKAQLGAKRLLPRVHAIREQRARRDADIPALVEVAREAQADHLRVLVHRAGVCGFGDKLRSVLAAQDELLARLIVDVPGQDVHVTLHVRFVRVVFNAKLVP